MDLIIDFVSQSNEKSITSYEFISLLLSIKLEKQHSELSSDELLCYHQKANMTLYSEIIKWETNEKISHYFWLTRTYFYCTMSDQPFWYFELKPLLNLTFTRMEIVNYLSTMEWCTSDIQLRLILTSLTLYQKYIGNDPYAMDSKNCFFTPNYILNHVIHIWKLYQQKNNQLKSMVIQKWKKKVQECKKNKLCNQIINKWNDYKKYNIHLQYITWKKWIIYIENQRSKQINFDLKVQYEIKSDDWMDSYFTLVMKHKIRIARKSTQKWKQFVLKNRKNRFLVHQVLQNWKHNVLIPSRIHNFKLERRMIQFLSRVLVLCIAKINHLVNTKAYSKECKLFLITMDKLTKIGPDLNKLKSLCLEIYSSPFYKIHNLNFTNPKFAAKISPFSSMNRLLSDLKSCVERLIKNINLIPFYVPDKELKAFIMTIMDPIYGLDVYQILRWKRNHNILKYMTFILDEIGMNKTIKWLSTENNSRMTLIASFETILPQIPVDDQKSIDLFQRDLRPFYTGNQQVIYDKSLQNVQIVNEEELKRSTSNIDPGPTTTTRKPDKKEDQKTFIASEISFTQEKTSSCTSGLDTEENDHILNGVHERTKATSILFEISYTMI